MLVEFALNHMTTARRTYSELLNIALEIGAVGVELRTDLQEPLFDGLDPKSAGEAASAKGLRILTLAEITNFNDWTDARAEEARALMQVAANCGAEAISLIPCNDGTNALGGDLQDKLRQSLGELKPMLEEFHLTGLIEPLGFESSSLRFKAEAVSEIEVLGAEGRFQLVHDTFHHYLAGGGPIFPEHTGIVHLSGVTDPYLTRSQMRDEHRGLVDLEDRLDNLGQIKSLLTSGYRGPFSFEAFSPEVINLADPESELLRSLHFIQTEFNQVAA